MSTDKIPTEKLDQERDTAATDHQRRREKRRAKTLAALEGDPWAEAASNILGLTNDPRFNLDMAKLLVRARTMFIDWVWMSWEDLPAWSRFVLTNACLSSLWSYEHGYWDSTMGVFRRPKERPVTS